MSHWASKLASHTCWQGQREICYILTTVKKKSDLLGTEYYYSLAAFTGILIVFIYLQEWSGRREEPTCYCF